MKAEPRRHPGEPELARLVRESPLLGAALKRRWLDILPYLTPGGRMRLRLILQAGSGRARRTSKLSAAQDALPTASSRTDR